MTTPPDRTFAAKLRINGEEDADLYQCIDSITVNEETEQGSSFQVEITLHREDDGSWTYLSEDRFLPWNRVTIVAAFPDHEDVVMDGYITHVVSTTDNGTSKLSVRGTDAAYHMNLEEKCRLWEELSFEDIARQIIEEYGLNARLEEVPGSEGLVPSVVQRATDYRFLRELARRRGYEFYVRGADAYFKSPELEGTPQKLIAIEFGDETNCEKLELEIDGTRPTHVSMERLDPLTGEIQTVSVTDSELPPLGRRDLGELRGGVPMPQTLVRLKRQVAGNEGEMTTLTRGYLRRYGFWITARGELDGITYGSVLRSRRTVTLKGFGRTHNGVYYVRKVRHQLQMRSYHVSFEAVRNRLEQLDSEDFEGERPDSTLPLAAGAGPSGEIVRVREQGAQVLP